MTRVKICGITRPEDARLAVELGASALGFNFYRSSPRYLAPAAARAILRELPPLVMPVGVFADETDSARVVAIAREAGMAAVQLHGPRFPALSSGLEGFWIIRAVAVQEGFKPEELKSLNASTFLLDSFDATLRGGTSKRFDWKLAREAGCFARIILAGGLTPESVGEAVRQARPFAVDVASGVESAPGKKDPAKLRAFFAAVAEADANLKSQI